MILIRGMRCPENGIEPAITFIFYLPRFIFYNNIKYYVDNFLFWFILEKKFPKLNNFSINNLFRDNEKRKWVKSSKKLKN